MTYDPSPGFGVPAPTATPYAATMPAGVAPSPPVSGGHLPQGVTVANPWTRLGSYVLDAVLVMVTLGIGWLIWASTTAGSGQTPGKRLLKLRVISASTLRPVGMGTMFWMRGLVAGFIAQFAVLFTLGIILFMPFWDRRNQNIWDKISSTYVVNDPFDAWGTSPDLRG